MRQCSDAAAIASGYVLSKATRRPQQFTSSAFRQPLLFHRRITPSSPSNSVSYSFISVPIAWLIRVEESMGRWGGPRVDRVLVRKPLRPNKNHLMAGPNQFRSNLAQTILRMTLSLSASSAQLLNITCTHWMWVPRWAIPLLIQTHPKVKIQYFIILCATFSTKN